MTNAEKFLEEFGNIDDEFIEEAMNYTMKKKFNFKPIIAIAACAALALAAVPVAKHFAGNPVGTQGTTATTQTPPETGGNFTVLYAGGADGSFIGAETKIETDFDGYGVKFTDDEKIGTTKTIVIDGVEYTGTYKDSTRSDYYRDDTDNYFAQIGNKRVEFTINRETGICRGLFVSRGETSGTTISRNEAYAKAIAHLKAYVPDIEKYELVNESSSGSVYDFIWQRTVNGIKTTDAASVTIRKTGEIFAHVVQSAGSFENTDISDVDKQKMEKALTDKINNVYAKYNEITYNAENIMLIRFANGKYAFEYRVNIEVRNDANKLMKDYGRFIIEIN
jgi:hypothetical protein